MGWFLPNCHGLSFHRTRAENARAGEFKPQTEFHPDMRLLPLLLLLTLPLTASAQLYRWVDANGRVTYSDQPPPANAQDVQQKKLGNNVFSTEKRPYGTRKAMQDFPVTLYTGQDCGKGCDEARAYLKQRGIAFSEKGLLTPEDAAAYRQNVGDGPLFVPALTVGSQKLKGFEKGAWERLLDETGYPRGGSPGQ
jgi:hypothetical protein